MHGTNVKKKIYSEYIASLLLQAQAAKAICPGRSSGPGDVRHCVNRADRAPSTLRAQANPAAAEPRNSIATLKFRRATLQKGSSLLRWAPLR